MNEILNTNTERKLATIEVIQELRPIANADKIEHARVRNWWTVVKKGEFVVGDKCVYFEIDSLLPKQPWSEFLVDKNRPDKPIRLKTIRLRGSLSQGLALPLSSFPGLSRPYHDGDGVLREFQVEDDVTSILGVIKYEPNEAGLNMNSASKGNFPSFARKSDEERLQNFYGKFIDAVHGYTVSISLKYDGTSATYFRNGADVGVCSRNLLLKEPEEGNEGSVYFQIEKKYDILNKLKGLSYNCQLIGEIYGEGIQKNRLGIQGIDIAFFTAFNIDAQEYLTPLELDYLLCQLELPSVQRVTYLTIDKNIHTMEFFLDMADNAKYRNSGNAEGIVIRCTTDNFTPDYRVRLSAKVISNNYLLKNGE